MSTTAQEIKFLDAGRRNKFAVTNWEAMTGIGRFDAVYNPQGNTLDVTFKVFTEFRDFNLPWRDDEKLAWEGRAFRVVEDFWSNRYLFKCTRPGWEKYKAAVNVRCVASAQASAHLHLRVDKVSPETGTQGGGVGWGTVPPTCLIDNLAIEPKNQRKLREGIFNLRLYQIEQGLKDHGIAVVSFPANSAVIPGPERLKLLDYAKYVHRIATKDVTGIQLIVWGGTGGGDRTLQMGLGKRRADAVHDALGSVIRDDTELLATDSATRKAGLKPKILEALSAKVGHAVTSTSFPGVVIAPRVPSGVDRAAEMNYIVLCHEFGHMLGLPDEYMGRLHPKLTARVTLDNLISHTLNLSVKSGDPTAWAESDQRKAGQQAGMAEMLKYNPDVRAPAFLDQNQIIDNIQVASSSIMYAGMEVMPAHYLTLWSCLAEMTWGYLNPSHWKIVPSPAHRGGVRYF